jgi:hypothetical protein
MRESGIRASSKPAQRSKLPADSCPPWQGIYLDMKKRAALYTPARRDGFKNSLGNGPETLGYTRTTSSVAPSEKNIAEPWELGVLHLTRANWLTGPTAVQEEVEWVCTPGQKPYWIVSGETHLAAVSQAHKRGRSRSFSAMPEHHNSGRFYPELIAAPAAAIHSFSGIGRRPRSCELRQYSKRRYIRSIPLGISGPRLLPIVRLLNPGGLQSQKLSTMGGNRHAGLPKGHRGE